MTSAWWWLAAFVGGSALSKEPSSQKLMGREPAQVTSNLRRMLAATVIRARQEVRLQELVCCVSANRRGIKSPLLGMTVIVDATVIAQRRFRAPSVASDSNGVELRALCLPSTIWTADDKEVVEDVPLFNATEFGNGEHYETEIGRTDRYCNDVGLRELVRKRFHA
jgi:hypothetical protein